jgi:NAD(P)-dependent dehydrogenase (short-subunit alcohol dehydrogenase family)
MANGMNDYFTGKHVLITGAGSGLGLALTEALLHRDAVVMATDAAPEKLAQLRKDPHYVQGQLMVEQLDVRRPQDFEHCVHILTSNGHALDVMINNAGVCAAGEFLHLSDTFWMDAMRINLEGTLNGCRIAATRMKEQGSGHIVNIASVSGLVPFPVTAPYNMSKAGIVALSRSLRMELAYRGIAVTVACPGQLQTMSGSVADGHVSQSAHGAY